MIKYISILILLVLTVCVSGCVDLFNNGQQRQEAALVYANETGAQVFNGTTIGYKGNESGFYYAKSHFGFYYPKNWNLTNYTESILITDPGDNSTYLYMYSLELKSNETAALLLQNAINSSQADPKREFEFVNQENVDVNNITYNILEAKESLNGTKIHYIQAWFENAGTAYILGEKPPRKDLMIF
ncbi:MAG: hypothetical protein ACP5C3_00515 [Methanomicrobiales archaeon]